MHDISSLQKMANKIARKEGFGKATQIVIGKENKVISHVKYGYRKKTTNQYVPKAYMSNFGWKNCYYQNAETVVEISMNDAFLAGI